LVIADVDDNTMPGFKTSSILTERITQALFMPINIQRDRIQGKRKEDKLK
jgi:hypothetical protein